MPARQHQADGKSRTPRSPPDMPLVISGPFLGRPRQSRQEIGDMSTLLFGPCNPTAAAQFVTLGSLEYSGFLIAQRTEGRVAYLALWATRKHGGIPTGKGDCDGPHMERVA